MRWIMRKSGKVATHPLGCTADDVVFSVDKNDALLVHKRHLIRSFVHCSEAAMQLVEKTTTNYACAMLIRTALKPVV